MPIWTDEDALEAAADWLWIPEGSDVVDGDITLIRRPAWAGGSVAVERTRSTRPVADLVDEAAATALAWGAAVLQWVVPDDAPELAVELEGRGAEVADALDILALPLADRPEPPPKAGVSARLVETRDDVIAIGRINAAVWGDAPLDDERLSAELGHVRRALADGTGFRVLATVDGEPACTGGVTLAPGPRGLGTVARLWGAATLEPLRGRGAYRAVLAERLRISAARGATLALVKGRVTTSAPILARAGFRRVGGERRFHLSL
jgi:hypothetical protein